jgi:hypothetical protein
MFYQAGNKALQSPLAAGRSRAAIPVSNGLTWFPVRTEKSETASPSCFMGRKCGETTGVATWPLPFAAYPDLTTADAALCRRGTLSIRTRLIPKRM